MPHIYWGKPKLPLLDVVTHYFYIFAVPHIEFILSLLTLRC